MPATVPATAALPQRKSLRKNLGWLWYFLLLAVLTVAAVAILVVYNLNQQLTPEQLEMARAHWEKNKPASYKMAYSIRINAEPNEDKYVVEVQNGKAVKAYVNGKPEVKERLHYYGMEQLFRYVGRFQDIDARKKAEHEKNPQPGQRLSSVYCRAIFDEKTGALRWYVRRVMGTRDRVEVTVDKLEYDSKK